jgi:hypothetical protein
LNNERESPVFYIQNSLFEITDTAVLIEMFILWRVPPAGRSGGGQAFHLYACDALGAACAAALPPGRYSLQSFTLCGYITNPMFV